MDTATHCAGSPRHSYIPRLRLLGGASGFALGLLAGPVAAADLIQGDWQFSYGDLDGKKHPVRLGRMEVYDQQPDGANTYRAIGPFGTSGPFPTIVTSLEGKASAQLETFEAGGIDPAGRILAATGGGSVAVSMNFKRDDDTAGANYFAQSPAVANVGGSFSALPYTVPGINTDEGRAFAAFDALVTGKRYLEFLGSQAMTINGVLGKPGISSVNQPATPDTRIFQLNVGLNDSPTKAGNISSDAFDWDVLLHEVGHAASFANGFNGYPIPGGNHSLTGTLTEGLAWSEGFSNFFQAAAQDWENRQPGPGQLPDVRIAAGKESIRDRITDYQDTIDADVLWSLETKNTLKLGGKSVVEAATDGERNEVSVARMLWDLLDGTGGSEGAVDQVTLGHKYLFDLLVKSKAKTFMDFVNLLGTEFTDARTRTDLGAIFAEHHVAARALGALRSPPSPVPPAAGAIVSPLEGGGPGAGDVTVQTPAKEATDAPPYPDPLPDPSTPAFLVGIDLPPILNWRAPWADDDSTVESYRLQLFRTGATLQTQSPGGADASVDTDWTARPELDLIRQIDLSRSSAGGTAGQFDTCGQPDALGYRCFRLGTDLIDELVGLGSESLDIYWNIVGTNTGADLDAGVWGNVAAFQLRRVPEPGMLPLMGLVAACAVFGGRSRRTVSR